MSNNEGWLPRSKKQKVCESGEVYVEALGGPMYDEATARKMLRNAHVWPLGGWGEGESGFDPDDAALDNVYLNENLFLQETTPMTYFAGQGDLKMMRYLISRGASTTKGAGKINSPMHVAVVEGRLDICKVLYANGAQDSVRLTNDPGWTPFLRAGTEERGETKYYDLTKWLVLHGALCPDGESDNVGEWIHRRWHRALSSNVYTTCQRLVNWSKDVLQAHSSVVTFLLGTLQPTSLNGQNCTLQCLSGNPGIRKLIGDFVGLEVTKAKQLRILRSLVEALRQHRIR